MNEHDFSGCLDASWLVDESSIDKNHFSMSINRTSVICVRDPHNPQQIKEVLKQLLQLLEQEEKK